MSATQTQSVLRQAQSSGLLKEDGEQSRTIGEKLLSLPLGKNVKDFLDYLAVEAGLSKNTVLAYGRDLIGFLKHCEFSKVSRLQQIRPALIQE